jgi:aspartate/glutamate racemase
MAGQEGDAERATARQAVANLRSRGVDGIILGCTEIPLLLLEQGLLLEHAQADDLVNPAQYLAEAAVRFAVESD